MSKAMSASHKEKFIELATKVKSGDFLESTSVKLDDVIVYAEFIHKAIGLLPENEFTPNIGRAKKEIGLALEFLEAELSKKPGGQK